MKIGHRIMNHDLFLLVPRHSLLTLLAPGGSRLREQMPLTDVCCFCNACKSFIRRTFKCGTRVETQFEQIRASRKTRRIKLAPRRSLLILLFPGCSRWREQLPLMDVLCVCNACSYFIRWKMENVEKKVGTCRKT